MTHEIIKAIIGLGNPGKQYYQNRHSIGFRILDALAKKYHTRWQKKENMEYAELEMANKKIVLIKPQTFMNNSGQVVPHLKKMGIMPTNILVLHDELELPFCQIKIKCGGSHKGHNGLKSIIQYVGTDFFRLRFGIGRPSEKEDVPEYVLQNFTQSEEEKINDCIDQAISLIEGSIQSQESDEKF